MSERDEWWQYRQHGMSEREYARLVARRGKQAWTADDLERLQSKVWRVAKGGRRG